MKNNMTRTKEELATINQDRYTKELTMKSIEVMKSKYDTFYDKLESFYDNIGS